MTLLVCIATQQEVTNLIPALELEVREVLSFVTERASRERWAEHLGAALRTRAVRKIPIPEPYEYSPGELAHLILEMLQTYRQREEPVCFAWAGGQKPQGVGVWQAFSMLSDREPGGGHKAAYMEQNRGELLIWDSPHQSPTPELLKRSPSIHELLLCYGQQPRPDTEKATSTTLWPNPVLPTWLNNTYDLYQNNQIFRRLCFEHHTAATKQNSLKIPEDIIIMNYLVRVNQRSLPEYVAPIHLRLSEHVQPNKPQEFPFLFELLVQQRVVSWLHTRSQWISEARANVAFDSTGQYNESSGELDIALLTRSGKLIALDAKISTKSAGTMRRAQESSVRQSGGDFAKRLIVFPAHSQDIAQEPDWFPIDNINLAKSWLHDKKSVQPLILFDDKELFEQGLDNACDIPVS
jgi:hypothetical protein